MNEVDAMGMPANPSDSSSWSTNGFDFPEQEFPLDNYAPSDFNSTDPLNTMFSESDTIDWVSLKGP
jgi:hypothetical protein